ncbi:MAG TPA: carbohydrate porin [Candidatus Xenobia bacterium]
MRNPTIGGDPYAARYCLRYTMPTGLGTEKVGDDQHQLAGTRPTDRVVVTVGKLGTSDIFDVNRYADNTRTQFMNWALINNAAWDYAADTRGDTFGAAEEWVHPTWALRAGSFEMPTIANGGELSTDLGRNRGDNIELEWDPTVLKGKTPARIRLLEYRNLAFMGTYRLALEQPGTPDVTRTRTQANSKYGYGLNVEQALGDEGDTGVFARFGWNDGNTESFAYTEADSHVSVGVQISGRHWNRPHDHWAMAWVDDNLSAPHAAYLAAGGLGFLLGDGRLNYGPEEVLETYYNLQASPTVTWALDYQVVRNPGYNHDRGPVNVLGVRFHFQE